MGKIATTLLLTGVIFFFSLIFILPSVALEHSPDYNFRMEYRMVNGKDNGMFYMLSAGSPATIRGTTQIEDSKPDALPPQDIYYTLYRAISWWFDKEYGSVNGGVNRDFSGTFPKTIDKTSGTYYLIIWRAFDDGNIVRGRGNLSN